MTKGRMSMYNIVGTPGALHGCTNDKGDHLIITSTLLL